jgi:hypothetical protein
MLLFVANVAVLYAAMTWASSTDLLIQILVGTLLPVLIVIPIMYFVMSVTSYNLLVAFNGLLLSNTLDDTNKTVSDMDTTTGNGNIAKHMEENLCKSFHCLPVKDIDDAIDLYQMANQQQQILHTHHHNSSNISNVKLSSLMDQKYLTGQEYMIPKCQPPNTTKTDKTK